MCHLQIHIAPVGIDGLRARLPSSFLIIRNLKMLRPHLKTASFPLLARPFRTSMVFWPLFTHSNTSFLTIKNGTLALHCDIGKGSEQIKAFQVSKVSKF
jgi:hypothetical protein